MGGLRGKTAHRKQLVLPAQMEQRGTDRIVSIMTECFFWPYMQRETEQYVMSFTCLKQKKSVAMRQEPLLKTVLTSKS